MDQTYSFKYKELLTITKNADTLLNSSVLWSSVQNFKANGQVALALGLEEHENLWFLLISFLVHNQNCARYIFYFAVIFTKKCQCKRKNMLFHSYWWTVIFTGKHMCWSLYLIKLQAFSLWTLFIKKRLLWILQNFKNSFFYRIHQVAASKWGNGKSKKTKLRK